MASPKTARETASTPRQGRHGPRSKTGSSPRQFVVRFLSRLTLSQAVPRAERVKSSVMRPATSAIDVPKHRSIASGISLSAIVVPQKHPGQSPQIHLPDIPFPQDPYCRLMWQPLHYRLIGQDPLPLSAPTTALLLIVPAVQHQAVDRTSLALA